MKTCIREEELTINLCVSYFRCSLLSLLNPSDYKKFLRFHMPVVQCQTEECVFSSSALCWLLVTQRHHVRVKG